MIQDFFQKVHVRGIPRCWPYIILFLSALLLFFGFFYCKAELENRFALLQNQLLKKGAVISGLKISQFPPSLYIKSLIYPVNQNDIKLSNIEIKPHFFPVSINMEGRLFNGTISAILEFESLFKPRVSGISFQIKNFSLPLIMECFKDKTTFVKILSGNLDGSGNINITWQGAHTDWNHVTGIINMELLDASFEPHIQLLKQKTLDNARSLLKVRISGKKCEIEEFLARSGDISFTANGEITYWHDPPNANLDLETTLSLPARDLNAELIPARTLEKLRENGVVRARIGRTLFHPSLHLVD